MIRCKLSTIMGERRLKIADIARGAEIHRNVVTRYYYDDVKAIDKDVLSRLCGYLDLAPGDLLEFVPDDNT